VDGRARRYVAAGEIFSTIRTSAGTDFQDNAFNDIQVQLLAHSSTSGSYVLMGRAFVLFDTSSIKSGATITSAILSLLASNLSSTNGLGSPDTHIVSSTPASNTTLAASDYGQIGSVSFGSLTWASIVDNVYNDFTLNASGINNISLIGISKFAVRNSWDINNSFTGTWVADGNTNRVFQAAESAGTSQDPKLVVTYTVPANPKQDVIWFD